MSYSILLSDQAREYRNELDEKSTRIVEDNLEKLQEDPYPRPDSGRGDVKNEVVDGQEIYRLHIGRTHTALFVILEDQKEVRIFELLPIDEAHQRYGFD